MIVRDFDNVENLVLVYPEGLKDPYYSSLTPFYDKLISLIPDELMIHLIVHVNCKNDSLSNRFQRDNLRTIKSDLFRDIWIRDYFGFHDNKTIYKPIFKPSFDDDPTWLDRKYRDSFNQKVKSFLSANFDQFQIKEIDLIWDGGNLIHNGNIGFITDKIFRDNIDKSQSEILELIKCNLGIEPIIVESLEDDVLAHTDGYLSFLSEREALVSTYPQYEFLSDNIDYSRKLSETLTSKGLNVIAIKDRPVDFYQDEDLQNSAEGNFINFLQLNDHVIIPAFRRRYSMYDINFLDFNKKLLSNHFNKVICIDSNQLSHLGGVLRCISWTF